MRHLLTAAVCAAFLWLPGCSQQTQEKVDAGAQAVVQDAKAAAQEAKVKLQKETADASLTASVKTALMASKQLDTSNLNVDTDQKTVFLKGSVATPEQKQLAEEIARRTVPKETQVVNQLETALATPQTSATASPQPGTTP